MIYRIVGAFLWLCEVGYDAKCWARKQWRKHIVSDCPPELDTCESCREASCDCTKVKTCNQIHGETPSKSRALYVQMIGRGPTAFDKHGLPVGRKVGRPTRRT